MLSRVYLALDMGFLVNLHVVAVVACIYFADYKFKWSIFCTTLDLAIV